MKITVNPKILLDGLRKCRLITKSAPKTMPAMGCVLLAGDKTSLALRANNSEQVLELTIEAKCQKNPLVALAVEKLMAIVEQAQGDSLEITIDDKFVANFTAKGLKAKLPGLKAEEMPLLPGMEDKPVLLPLKGLAALLARLRPFAGDDETRAVLNGVHLASAGINIRVESTNGRIMARFVTTIPTETVFSLIVPNNAVDQIVGLLGDDEEVELAIHERLFVVRASAFSFQSVVVQGPFPQMSQYIPGARKKTIQGNRDLMLNAIRAVAPFYDTTKAVALACTKQGLCISPACLSQDNGQMDIEIPDSEGPDITIILSGEFLTKTLTVLEQPDAILHVETPNDSVLVREDGMEVVIMPMRRG